MVKRENARLRAEAARLGASERIQAVAAERGLVLPAPDQVRYLKSNPGADAEKAARRLAARPAQPAATPVDPAAVAPVTPAPAAQAPVPPAQVAAPAQSTTTPTQ